MRLWRSLSDLFATIMLYHTTVGRYDNLPCYSLSLQHFVTERLFHQHSDVSFFRYMCFACTCLFTEWLQIDQNSQLGYLLVKLNIMNIVKLNIGWLEDSLTHTVVFSSQLYHVLKSLGKITDYNMCDENRLTPQRPLML